MRTHFWVFFVLMFTMVSFGQDDLAMRSMLKRTVFFVTTDGKIQSADYWAMPMGRFDFTVKRQYPGEGEVTVNGSTNLSLISSGYIEGKGYGDRGKITVDADFMVKRSDTLTRIKLADIDFVYMGGTEIKLKNHDKEELFIMIENPENTTQAKRLGIALYTYIKDYGEIEHARDIERIIGFSFTREGASRAWKAALEAANAQ